MMKAIVFGGASIDSYAFCEKYVKEADLIVCCDGGMEHAKNLHLLPHYIVGDFDSVSKETLAFFQSKSSSNNIKIEQFPCEKDQTDLQIGLKRCMEQNATEITIIGGMGNRFDHTLANAHLLLSLSKQNIKGRLIDAYNCVELINKPTTIFGSIGDLVSLIPLSMCVENITLTGFLYPLYNHTLYLDDELIAVSNVLLEEQAEISLKNGYLFVIRSRDETNFQNFS